MRVAIRAMGLVAAAACLWFLVRIVFVGEETRVRRHIARLESAVETGNLLRLADGIAVDYTDQWGLDKPALIGLVRTYRHQHEGLFIHITDLKVELDADRQMAVATLVAKIAVKPKEGGGETELFVERFRLFLRKGEDGWKLWRVESPELKFD